MIEQLITPKEQLYLLDENLNCHQALQILEKLQVRCAPVVDNSHTIFRGNIHTHHLYHFIYHHPEIDLSTIPVTRFLKNATRFVCLTQSLPELLFSIKNLPYIAVLDKDRAFLGVIYNSELTQFLHQAWGISHSAYILRVETTIQLKSVMQLLRIVNKYCEVSSIFTIDKTDPSPQSYVFLQIDQSTSQRDFHQLIRILKNKHYVYDYWSI